MDFRIVDGRLTRDSEVKIDKKGREFLSFTLANNSFSSGAQTTTYFNVVSYNSHDIEKQPNYTKGKLVVVSGKPNESMTIKDNKTYLNRNIMAYSIEGGTFISKEETSGTTTYHSVAPSTPTVETPNIPTLNIGMNNLDQSEQTIRQSIAQSVPQAFQANFDSKEQKINDDYELPF